ncbi:MAG: XRE family transcriptional regulator [Magnetococcales bacterium]|nr:XRE family transcriptional regulator [Magnetococcales bacterium]
MSEERIPAEQSSGNVFADLNVSDPEEALAKAMLASRISDIITHRHLTQAQAAEILGIKQPHVSDLVRGRLKHFTMDRLFRFLNALDRDVQIVIKKKPRSKPAARTFVVPVQA